MTPFGIELRKHRLEKGITMALMAKTLGVSTAYLSQIETGKKGQPSAVMVDRICAMLGLIWDDAEALKDLARLSKPRAVIDTTSLSAEATRAANLMAEVLPRIDEDEARLMAEWLQQRRQTL